MSRRAPRQLLERELQICGVEAESSVQWWNPATKNLHGLPSSQTPPTGDPPFLTVTPVVFVPEPVALAAGGPSFAVTAPSLSGREENAGHR